MKKVLAIGLISGLLVACNPFDIKSHDTLTGSDPDAARSAPNCAQCHAFPPHDIMHEFHLTSYVVQRDQIANLALNGPLTCMDCHFKTIRHFTYVVADSTWVDSNGNEIEGPTSPGDTLLIDFYRRYHPLPYPATGIATDTSNVDSLARALDTLIRRELQAGRLVQWMTSMAHLDGRREVEFPPNNLEDSALSSTAFRPYDLSCSAVACHNRSQLVYRFASPVRGISPCPSLLKSDTTCGDPAP